MLNRPPPRPPQTVVVFAVGFLCRGSGRDGGGRTVGAVDVSKGGKTAVDCVNEHYSTMSWVKKRKGLEQAVSPHVPSKGRFNSAS